MGILGTPIARHARLTNPLHVAIVPGVVAATVREQEPHLITPRPAARFSFPGRHRSAKSPMSFLFRRFFSSTPSATMEAAQKKAQQLIDDNGVSTYL